ncbi:MAG: hypothetical protein JWQ04_858 [Pedosphaera sp.]|nr:hypothetical protein [Pedosphaera sp.]
MRMMRAAVKSSRMVGTTIEARRVMRYADIGRCMSMLRTIVVVVMVGMMRMLSVRIRAGLMILLGGIHGIVLAQKIRVFRAKEHESGSVVSAA